ncbi:MAG: 8-amino-7-oxononanoate synthase [bacterium]|nr:8-amino-7-oxononanoate synthase [bacterium]
MMGFSSPWSAFFQDRLEAVRQANRYRAFRVFDTFQPGYICQHGKTLLNLSANDYLGLAGDEEGREEARLLAEILPYGGSASRLVTGNLAIHHELEKLLAEWKGTQAALLFASGYQTNVGLLSALASKGDAIFSDKWNHASIIDGCLLSGAHFNRYRHNDLEDLESLLRSKRPRKRIIVTDGVFSMDGDLALLPELNTLAQKYNALLIVDEAHATGILGPHGAGSWAHYQLPVAEHVILMGTLSKAVGVQGGYVCASQDIIEYLINYCRSQIYSTALSPLLAGLIHFNINRIISEPNHIEACHHAARVLKSALQKYEIQGTDTLTPILPIHIGESQTALVVADALFEQGTVAVAIRPPTVPEGKARLRLSVCAAHRDEDLKQAAQQIATIFKSHGHLPGK